MTSSSQPQIVAGMATMPSRIGYAERAIRSVLKNANKLYLFLDNFNEIPTFAKHEKIIPLLSQEWGDHKANGKFLGLKIDDKADYYLACDDDIEYAENFSRRLLSECIKYGNNISIGIHGSNFHDSIQSYSKDRKIRTLRERRWFGCRVDVIATCGCLHSVKKMRFNIENWDRVNMVDLCYAFEAKKSGLDLRLISQPRKWVRPITSKQEDSIYHKLIQDDTTQTSLVNDLLNR
ncbi:MAG: hypothetical protein ACRBBN_15745 [Methyloligellaceae bacterium]